MHSLNMGNDKSLLIIPLWIVVFNFKEYQGVSIGGGTGSISDILDSAQLICEKVSSLEPTGIEELWWFFLVEDLLKCF